MWQQVVMDNKEELAKQLATGMCIRITEPSELITTKYPHKKPLPKEGESVEVEVPKKQQNQTVIPQTQALNNLSLEKMWVISSLVGEYLKDDFYKGSN